MIDISNEKYSFTAALFSENSLNRYKHTWAAGKSSLHTFVIKVSVLTSIMEWSGTGLIQYDNYLKIDNYLSPCQCIASRQETTSTLQATDSFCTSKLRPNWLLKQFLFPARYEPRTLRCGERPEDKSYPLDHGGPHFNHVQPIKTTKK